MKVINVRNVNHALQMGLDYLRLNGLEEPSRNGKVLVAPGPVTTAYTCPNERVLFNDLRDANPFFHLMESIWMLAGRNDVALPAHYAAQMQLYSDDEKTLNGSAYGHRWQTYFGFDQLEVIIHELRDNPASRRCVLAMWDARDSRSITDRESLSTGIPSYMGDLNFAMNGGKDIPCNTHIYFRVQDGILDMTVCNRSNDAVWGAYGANAVHFSVLHEYMATAIGVALGTYYQISNNFHAYIERPDTVRLMKSQFLVDNRYSDTLAKVYPTPVMKTPVEIWRTEMNAFLSRHPVNLGIVAGSYQNVFFNVATRMAAAHKMYKDGSLGDAVAYLKDGGQHDWLVAGAEWIQRRIEARNRKVGA
jgi:hypothetical protein